MRNLRGFALRRAVLGTLMLARRPMSVAEVVAALAERGCTTGSYLAKPPHGVVANLLD